MCQFLHLFPRLHASLAAGVVDGDGYDDPRGLRRGMGVTGRERGDTRTAFSLGKKYLLGVSCLFIWAID